MFLGRLDEEGNYALTRTILPSFPSVARPLASRPFLIPSIHLICIAGSLLPRGKFRASILAIILLSILSKVPNYTFGDAAQDYLLPVQITLAVLQWVDFFCVHDAEEFKRRKDGGKMPQSWWGRLGWVTELHCTTRGIGWDWEVKNVPSTAPEGTTKWLFAWTELRKGLLCYLLMDVGATIVASSIYNTSSPPSLFSDTILRQILFAWIPSMGSYYALNMQYSTLAALGVACGLYTPQDWPAMMGKLKNVLTVRDFWGYFWHQMLRRSLNLPFNFLKRYMHITRGTLFSRYMQLWLAFIMSALIHHIGALNLPLSSPSNNRLQLIYFLSQPLAIMAEDFITYLGKKAGIKSSWKTRALGRIWTFGWFTWSLRYAVAFNIAAKLIGPRPMPSLIEWVISPLGKISARGGHNEL